MDTSVPPFLLEDGTPLVGVPGIAKRVECDDACVRWLAFLEIDVEKHEVTRIQNGLRTVHTIDANVCIPGIRMPVWEKDKFTERGVLVEHLRWNMVASADGRLMATEFDSSDPYSPDLDEGLGHGVLVFRDFQPIALLQVDDLRYNAFYKYAIHDGRLHMATECDARVRVRSVPLAGFMTLPVFP